MTGAVALPFLGTFPSTIGHVMPLGTPTRRETSLSLHGPPIDQTYAVWICASVSTLDPRELRGCRVDK